MSDISVISRGKRDLAYLIFNKTKGNYIQLNFSSMPKYINTFSNTLSLIIDRFPILLIRSKNFQESLIFVDMIQLLI